jgi:hypothetical protein
MFNVNQLILKEIAPIARPSSYVRMVGSGRLTRADEVIE